MTTPTARFASKTLDSFVYLLSMRRTSLTRFAEALRSEAADALSQRDISDLLDDEDPSTDSDAATVLMLVQRAEGRLWEVEKALDSVAEGTYGYCIECGDAIPLVRLRALPATAWCVECSRQSSQGLGNVCDARL